MPDDRSKGFVQIIFRSLCVSQDRHATLEDLGGAMRSNGHGVEFTGFLVMFGNDLVGLIEGDQSNVMERIERISVDHRNEQLRVLREAHVSERRFEDWTWHCLDQGPGQTDTDGALANLFAERLSRALYQNALDQ